MEGIEIYLITRMISINNQSSREEVSSVKEYGYSLRNASEKGKS